jgi:hypothetical protein
MGATDGRPEEVREQVATVMRKAQEILGSREKLAERIPRPFTFAASSITSAGSFSTRCSTCGLTRCLVVGERGQTAPDWLMG